LHFGVKKMLLNINTLSASAGFDVGRRADAKHDVLIEVPNIFRSLPFSCKTIRV